jgi:hypothetical protein
MDCLFITVYPTYPALLGPLLKKRAGIPFVLDYQDPWVGSWGSTTGPNGIPDWKSRVSRFLAQRLEPLAAGAADGITAVSRPTYEAVQERVPKARTVRCLEIPLGGESADFEFLRVHQRRNPIFDRGDGRVHISYVGTLLPKGLETLQAFLAAMALMKDREPASYAKLRVHFVGTSNQTGEGLASRALAEATRKGVAEGVDETPQRVGYLDALTVLTQSDAVLLMGSSERHYTASKLYPALLSRRPILAIFHEDSSVVSLLERAVKPPSGRLVAYDDQQTALTRVEAVYQALLSLVRSPDYDPRVVDFNAIEEFSARSMAKRLAALFDAVAPRTAG